MSGVQHDFMTGRPSGHLLLVWRLANGGQIETLRLMIFGLKSI